MPNNRPLTPLTAKISLMGSRQENFFIVEGAVILFLLVAGALTIPITGTNVNNNAAKYLHQAAELQAGREMSIFKENSIARGPVFPLLLALMFETAGRSVLAAMVLVRILNVLDIVLVYLLGRILYDRSTGLIAAMLAMTSYGIFWCAGWIESGSTHIFFLLLFFLLIYQAYRSGCLLLYALAGAILGIAFLVKESALVYMTALVLFFFLSMALRRRRVSSGLLICLGVLTCFVAPWVIYVGKRSGSLWLALGALSPQQTELFGVREGYRTTVDWVIDLGWKIPVLLRAGYTSYLKAATPLAPLLVIAWAVALVRGVMKRKPADLLITFGSLLWLPIVFGSLATGDTLRQVLIVYYLLYIAFGSVLTSQAALLSRKLNPALSKGLLVSVGIVAVLYQLTAGGTWKLWREGSNGTFPLALGKPAEMIVGSRYTNDDRALSLWLMKNVEPGSKLLVDGVFCEAMDFYSGFALPYDKSLGRLHMDQYTFVTHSPGRTLFVLPYSKIRSYLRRYRLVFFVEEEGILNAIRRSGAHYAVITRRSLFLSRYFDSVPWAKLVHSARGSRVYRIDPVAADKLDQPFLCVGATLMEDLDWLKKEHLEEYKLVAKALAHSNLTTDMLSRATCTISRDMSY